MIVTRLLILFLIFLIISDTYAGRNKDERRRSENDDSDDEDGSGQEDEQRGETRGRGRGQGRGHGRGPDPGRGRGSEPGRGRGPADPGPARGRSEDHHERGRGSDSDHERGHGAGGSAHGNNGRKTLREGQEGTLVHAGKKLGKKPTIQNPKTYVWKGKKITVPGLTGDIAPPVLKIANFSRLPLFGKSCKTANAPTAGPPTEINQGPAAEGFKPEHFKPCQDRKRGSKRTKLGRDDSKKAKGHKREKRSQTYSSISWLWSDPENIPIAFDRSCKCWYMHCLK